MLIMTLKKHAKLSNIQIYLGFFIQDREKAMSVLKGLLQDLAAELQDERIECDSKAKATPGKPAEVRMVFTPQACVPRCV